MLAAAMITACSVALRKLTGFAIPGDFEITEIATALAIFAFFPLCQARRGHVIIDSATTRLPPSAIRLLDRFWEIIAALIWLLLAWRLTLGAIDTIASRTTTMALGLPTGWAMAAAALLASIAGLVALLRPKDAQ